MTTSATSATSATTTTSTPTDTSQPTSSEGVIAGVVVIVVILLAVAVVTVIILLTLFMRNKNTSKKKASNNGLQLQEAPIMEYSTISSRGYEGDTTKSPDRLQFSSEYSQLQTTHPTSGNKELVYADLGGSKPKKASEHHVMPAAEDRVVYSTIDTKATAKQKQKEAHNADTSLDLNMMLIQVRAVITSWFPFGEALGVPEEVLKEVQRMALEDYDKLVEVLDYWFRAFPKGNHPTWRTVAIALQTVGFDELSAQIMKVYTTGQLPIVVNDEVPRDAYGGDTLPPPPLPPKEDFGATLPPQPATVVPPRPPKANMSQSLGPPRPPKSSALAPAAPLRPPKPGNV